MTLSICLLRSMHMMLTQSAIPMRKLNIVPMNLLIFSFWPEPRYCEIMTWPAPEKPIAMNVKKPVTSPPTETADRPTFPSFCPTMIMSTML